MRGQAHTLGARVAFSGLLAVLVIAAMLTASSLVVRDMGVKQDEALRAEAATATAARSERLLIELQSSSRGFVISGQGRYVEMFESARAEVPARQAEIERLLADRPGARAEVRALGRAIADYADA